MNLDRVAMDLRPLSPAARTDLGLRLAQHWYGPLLALWLMAAAPVIALAVALAWWLADSVNPLWFSLLAWWFKPMAELAQLHWCGRALPGERPPLWPSVRRAWASVPRLLASYLSWRRLSPYRGVGLCAIELERIPLGQAGQRLRLLFGHSLAVPGLLIAFAHFELIGVFGGELLWVWLIPEAAISTQAFDQHWLAAFWNTEDNLITFTLSVIIAALVAPFFSAASFCHYINRRSELEGWDLQWRFDTLGRRLRHRDGPTVLQRAASVLGALLLGGLLSLSAIDPVQAAPDREAARERIEAAMDDARFGQLIDHPRLRWRADDAEEDTTDPSNWLDTLRAIFEAMRSDTARWVLWALVGGLALFAAWQLWRHHGSDWLRHRERSRAHDKPGREHPQAPPSFDRAHQLLDAGKPREAIGCALAVFWQWGRAQGAPLRDGHTETEASAQLQALMDEPRRGALDALMQLWRQLVWAGRPVSVDQIAQRLDAARESWSGERP